MSAYSCLHPVTIHNARGTFKVPCGKCEACINRKASTLSLQCDIEALRYKYCYFLTLTYGDEYLPLVRVIRHAGKYVFLDVSSRDCYGKQGVDGTRVMAVEEPSSFDDAFFVMYYNKLNLHPEYYGLIPYLSRRDYQLFLKRLRKYLSNYTNETVRYYVCGEYGPQHFRPHFHFLLFFDSDKISKCLGKGVASCWKYGRIDLQVSKGKCNGYVSKYVNSLANLSAVQRLAFARPFSAHSRFFGQSFFENEAKAIGKAGFRDFAGKSIVVNGKSRPVFPWLAFQSNLFPKCYGYGSSDSHVRLFCYTATRRVQKEIGSCSVRLMATACADDYFSGDYKIPFVKEFHDIFGSRNGVVTEQTFLSIFYTSNKFFKLCETFSLTPSALLKAIENYYSEKDYENLKKQLNEQSEFISLNGTDFLPFLLSWYDNFEPITEKQIVDYELSCENVDFKNRFSSSYYYKDELFLLDKFPYYYPKCVLDYMDSIKVAPFFVTDYIVGEKNNILYQQFSSIQKRIYYGSIKHKKLNDLNKIFSYGKYNVAKKRA